MSRYCETETCMRDPKHLVAALEEQGFTVECHEETQTLYGYHGDARPEKAHVIIRRQHTGIDASNDVGFVRGADGTFRAIISEYDASCKFTDAWLGTIKQGYKTSQTIAMARAKGYQFKERRVVETEKGKRVQLVFAPR